MYDPKLGYDPALWDAAQYPLPAGLRILKHGARVPAGTEYFALNTKATGGSLARSFIRVSPGWVRCTGYPVTFVIGITSGGQTPYAVRNNAVPLHEDEGG